HLAITGMETAAMISRIFLGLAIRATPPSARICAGTRSRAMTEVAPAFSAISACLASVASMMTTPFSISARPVFKRRLVELPLFWDIVGLFSWCEDRFHIFYRVIVDSPLTAQGRQGNQDLTTECNEVPRGTPQRKGF